MVSVPIIITVYGHMVQAGNLATANHKYNNIKCVTTNDVYMHVNPLVYCPTSTCSLFLFLFSL